MSDDTVHSCPLFCFQQRIPRNDGLPWIKVWFLEYERRIKEIINPGMKGPCSEPLHKGKPCYYLKQKLNNLQKN